MKTIKVLGFTSLLFLSFVSYSLAEGSLYTDVIGITHYSNGVTSKKDLIGNTLFSNGLTYYTDAIGNTHYSSGLNGGLTGTSYVDKIGNTHFTFSDGTTIVSYTDAIGNSHYSDNKGNTGTSYTDAIGKTYYSGSLFRSECPTSQVYDSVVNKCIIKNLYDSSSRHDCKREELSVLKQKYNIDQQETKVNDLKKQITDLDTERKFIPYNIAQKYVGFSGAGSGSAASSAIRDELSKNNYKTINLNYQLEDTYSKYNSDLNSVKEECYVLGDASYAKILEENIKKQNDIDNSLKCIAKFGDNSYFDSSSCQCSSGYKMDNNRSKCVSNSELVCPLNSSPLNGKCSCDAGTISDSSNNCLSLAVYCQTVLKTTVAKDGLSCTCSQGQVFNKVNNTCSVGSTVVSSPIAIFKRTLKKGMVGTDVKNLQLLLVKLKYLPETRVTTTVFDTATNNALIKFQKDNKIKPATGSFGPATQAKLLSLTK